jgi:hypothetical protein
MKCNGSLSVAELMWPDLNKQDILASMKATIPEINVGGVMSRRGDEF